MKCWQRFKANPQGNQRYRLQFTPPFVWPLIQKATKAAAVDRLTDTSKYTGSHKERFDTSGKGRGKAGREDAVESSGYVGAYKGSGTYDEKVKNA